MLENKSKYLFLLISLLGLLFNFKTVYGYNVILDEQITDTLIDDKTREVEYIIRYTEQVETLRIYNVSSSFEFKRQKNLGECYDFGHTKFADWYANGTLNIEGLRLELYKPNGIICKGLFDLNTRKEDDFYVFYNRVKPVKGTNPDEGLGKSSYRVRIPKYNFLISELVIHSISPIPDLQYEDGKYVAFQWSKEPVSKNAIFFDVLIKYRYEFPLRGLVLGFLGAMLVIILDRIVSRAWKSFREKKRRK